MDGQFARAISASETAVQALYSAKSVHYRLDEIKDNQKCQWRTVIGTILAEAISALIKFNGDDRHENQLETKTRDPPGYRRFRDFPFNLIANCRFLSNIRLQIPESSLHNGGIT